MTDVLDFSLSKNGEEPDVGEDGAEIEWAFYDRDVHQAIRSSNSETLARLWGYRITYVPLEEVERLRVEIATVIELVQSSVHSSRTVPELSDVMTLCDKAIEQSAGILVAGG